MVLVDKQNKNQMPSKKNQAEIAEEITPKTDEEYAEEVSYNSPAKGMNKRQQRQKKQ